MAAAAAATYTPPGKATAEEAGALTNALTDIGVAEVRKGLALIRRKWDHAHSDPKAPPMYPSDGVGVNNMSLEAFALKFVVGHHSRRSSKAKETTTSRSDPAATSPV